MSVVIGTPFHCGRPAGQAVVCQCDCGSIFCRAVANLLNGGEQSSCGCLKSKQKSEQLRRQNHIHGDSKTRLHKIWRGILQRCNSPSCNIYKNYGGRGIRVCAEWHDYEKFRSWATFAGYSDSLTIERESVNGDYCPGNCSWKTMQQQARNRRRVVLIDAFGESKPMWEWLADSRCKITHRGILNDRLRRGWSPEKAITTPKGRP